MNQISIFILIVASISGISGTSPPEILPELDCQAPEEPCGDRLCYNPAEKQCLTYKNGRGGFICAHGDTLCAGFCLTPNSGRFCAKRHNGYRTLEWICDDGQELCGMTSCYKPEAQVCLEGIFVCNKGQQNCGRYCYVESEFSTCITGESGWSFVCKPNEKVCGSLGCYNTDEKDCNEQKHELTNKA